MANEEHVAPLRQGVNVWNAWREKEPSIRPDLSGANLTEANLGQAKHCRTIMPDGKVNDADCSKGDWRPE